MKTYYRFCFDDSLRLTYLINIDYFGWKPKYKILEDVDVIFTANETLKLSNNDKPYTIEPYQAFVALPGETIIVTPDHVPIKGVYILHFASDSLTRVNTVEPGDTTCFYLSKIMTFNDSGVFKLLASALSEQQLKKHGYERLSNIMLQNILLLLSRSCVETEISEHQRQLSPTQYRHVKVVLSFLNKAYMNDIKSQDITAECNLNYSYINDVFKRVTGKTIMQQLAEIRVSHAEYLLESTNLNIAEISAIVGYADPLYFSKIYKKHHGKPPSRDRQDA